MSSCRRNRAFTLIEVLVVVAIIALLVSILIPSLDAARKQSRTVVCQSNLRSLMVGFMTYAAETRGYLPGCSEDTDADWLGLSNKNKLNPNLPPRQPEDGTIFKHVGRQKHIYRCPDDDQYRDTSLGFYSYTTCTLFSGANAANVGVAHYRLGAPGDPLNYHKTDHRANMRPNVAMVIIEEDLDWYLLNCNNSAWDNCDGVTQRHPRKRGNVACIDGHVQSVSLPTKPRTTGKFFESLDQCVRYGNKWVSGLAWYDDFYRASNGRGAYRAIERAKPAEAYGVQHVH
ncbi:MAG: type II secretion system protein [Phycisphaerae bacterium]|jgi:prepilin-type N-terminal cleavage/methylation domain-containing protein